MLENDIELIDKAIYRNGVNYVMQASWDRIKKELVVGQKTTTNIDYAAALRVFDEYARSTDRELSIPAVVSWCKERLNSSTNIA